MTRKDSLRKLKQILIQRRAGLRETLHGELQRFNTMDERVVGDELDLVLDTDYGLINSQLAEAESRELEQIEYALERVRDGSYGTCETCGKNISLARLQALPYATNCIRCQRHAERSGTERQQEVDWSRIHDEAEPTARFPSIDLMNMVV